MAHAEVLTKITQSICFNQPEAFLQLADIFIEEHLSTDEIQNFLQSLNFIPARSFTYPKPVIGISGSGGSGFCKPNLSTLTCIYLAAEGTNWIVKTGSTARTSKFGSSDLLNDLGLTHVSCNEEALIKHGFAFFDVDEFIPWKKFKGLLSMNKCFDDFFSLHQIHDLKYDLKLTGVLGSVEADLYLNKVQILEPENLFCIWTQFKDRGIDEFLTPDTRIGDLCFDKQKITFDLEELPFIQISSSYIKALNRSLLAGTCNEKFWVTSLKLGFAITLFVAKSTSTLEEGFTRFDKLYKDRVVAVWLKDYINGI